ncbi:unnamed protein product [Rotaria magnacalcarata]
MGNDLFIFYNESHFKSLHYFDQKSILIILDVKALETGTKNHIDKFSIADININKQLIIQTCVISIDVFNFVEPTYTFEENGEYEKFRNSLTMSTQNESVNSSIPVLYFVKSHKTEPPSTDNNENEISSNHDNKTEQPPTGKDTDEKPITTASHSRRVHFPTDDTQLRLISYLPEPLSNQPLVSLGVILQRYRAACQRLQLRPLNCLLEQLSTMDDGRNSYCDRLDCLKVVNEKLELKHIDTIEEILSRCRFHTLDFESTFIDDATLGQLFDVLEYYEACTHINLSHNRSIGFQGYQALTKYLRKTNSLERLDMNSARFDDNSILNFTRSLRLSSTLYELHVESCQLSGKLLQKFIQHLRSCTCLRELYLCDNRLQVQDSLQINELIRTCGQFLFLLDLRSNSLQDTGVSHLASQFSQYDENHTDANLLHKLSLQGNQITPQGVGFLAKSLLHNRTLRSLNLSDNSVTNEGLIVLRDALLMNRTITELILRNCHLTDQAAIALAEFIAESTTIQYIDIRNNNIQASGICGMSIAMKNNKSLLRLDYDPISSTPTHLSLSSNNINRTTNSSSLLSMTSLRKMTTGFGSFTTSTPFSVNRGGGGGTRELLEQKAKWMSDITTVCQRNKLIYEEKIRLEEEEQQQNRLAINETDEIQQKDSTITKSEDSLLEEETSYVIEPKDHTHSEDLTAINQNSHEEIQQSADADGIEQLNGKSSDDNKEFEDSLNSQNNKDNQTDKTSMNHSFNPEQSIVIPIEDHDEFKQTVDISEDDGTKTEQTIAIRTINDNQEIEQLIADLVESVVNGDRQGQSESNIINQSSIDTESLSMSVVIDDISNDDKRKLHHSDSLRIMRKKVKNENDETSDDESQLSSSLEKEEQIVDGS